MKPKQAVALKYERQGDVAPRVVAKGSGEVAQAILRIAEQGNVPVRENSELAQALMALDVDAVIPEELYQVVAEILAVIYGARE